MNGEGTRIPIGGGNRRRLCVNGDPCGVVAWQCAGNVRKAANTSAKQTMASAANWAAESAARRIGVTETRTLSVAARLRVSRKRQPVVSM